MAEADLIGLVLGHQDLHAGREDLEDVEGANRRVDLLLLDSDDLGYAVGRIHGLLTDLEVVAHAGGSPRSNASAIAISRCCGANGSRGASACHSPLKPK